MMRLRTVTPLVALVLTLILAQAPLVSGAASYALSISPNVPVSLGTGMTFTLTISGGTRNSAYTVLFNVVKPNGTGSALATKVITTNNAGTGSLSLNYPDPSFTPLTGPRLLMWGASTMCTSTRPLQVPIAKFRAASLLLARG